jgi:hypothetical protein
MGFPITWHQVAVMRGSAVAHLDPNVCGYACVAPSGGRSDSAPKGGRGGRTREVDDSWLLREVDACLRVLNPPVLLSGTRSERRKDTGFLRSASPARALSHGKEPTPEAPRRKPPKRYNVVSYRFQLTPFGCGVASSADREWASYASRARAGRSRQCQSKWAGSRVWCTRTALVTAPF